MAIRRKKVSSAHSVKLFVEDEDEIKARIKRGTYKTFSDATRALVSLQLSSERLAQYGDDALTDKFKKKQREVLEPMDRNLTAINSTLEKIQQELADSRKVNRDVVEALQDAKAGVQSDELISAKLSRIEKVLNEMAGVLDYIKRMTMRLLKNLLNVRGNLLFFNLGYSAGKIKPAKVINESKFLETIEGAGRGFVEQFKSQIEGDISTDLEDELVRNFAQSLINVLYQIGDDPNARRQPPKP